MNQTENLQRIAQYLYESLLKDICHLDTEHSRTQNSPYHAKYYSNQNDNNNN